MERSDIRVGLSIRKKLPDFAALNPGYKKIMPGARPGMIVSISIDRP
jgi:hypothetical protein